MELSVMNGEGIVLDFSPAAEEVFGWSAKDIVRSEDVRVHNP